MNLKPLNEYIIISLIGVLSITSCKKETIIRPSPPCTTAVSSQPSPNQLVNIFANGFFVFKNYYTIHSNGLTHDSVFNYAMEIPKDINQTKINYFYKAHYGPVLIDSFKVNNVKYQAFGPTSFFDITKTLFNPPRVCQLFADTTYYDVINYTDNTLMPSYTGYVFLPDSVYYNADFFINVGAKANTKETQIDVYYTKYNYSQSYFLDNNSNTYTVPSITLPYDYSKDKVDITIIMRNWHSISINGREYYFVYENTYFKK